ncbi:MAG: sugar kinase [Bacteroidetes Order II. Incertae sedis bacterium]|jgi:sugar/nucleoside kinase (ribokinase family)|nr:sugar kinase [Bacteroidetes Order II. bacterium]MBT4051555.1 sugar kinase [Bacteroidetes Order II. bacterium]MBT4603557.1 sugar kinase [Bacteroidetes Order II. bacterium]MBT5251043.1 sugar kinase [Bacteroidetes Order II. bacterium]MBT6200150.1 sugar kinase [Bacteroidetes Order II. bacterium]
MSVLAVGTVAFDQIETPFGKRDKALGGSAMYITMAARFMCDDVRLVAVVGNDFPPEYREVMASRQINLAGLEVQEDGLTFAWGGRYHYDLNNRDTVYTDLNVLATFDPVLPAEYRDANVLCLGNLDPGVQDSVLNQVVDPSIVICDTMNYWIEQTPEKLKHILSRVDCLVVNDSEARELSDSSNLVVAAKKIREMGPEIVVIKKGEHGALLFANESVFMVPAYPLEDIQDPTGAGDAFMGGFAGFLSGCKDIDLDSLKHALVHGSAVASFTVEQFGPEGLYDLSRLEIEKRIDAFRDLTTIPVSAVTPF